MICGACKGNHPHVADVRACYASKKAVSAASHHPTTTVGSESTTAARRPMPRDYVPPVQPPFVPAGRYAVPGPDGALRFYRVDRPTEGKWQGYTFVKVYASDTTWTVKGEGRSRVLHEIAKDPKAAMLRYGQEIGQCGHCGRTLTDEHSRAMGVGPVCAENLGWAS